MRALAAVTLAIAVSSWAAPPEPPSDELTNQVYDLQEAWRKAEWDNVPGKTTVPYVVIVRGTKLKIYYDPDDFELEERVEAFIEAIEKLKDHGFVLPAVIDVLFSTYLTDRDHIAQAYPFLKPAVAVGMNCIRRGKPPKASPQPFWSIEDQRYYEGAAEAKSAKKKWWVCGGPSLKGAKADACVATVVHEICHLLHAGQSLDDAVWNAKKSNEADPRGGWVEAADEVSQYAKKKRNEFVAEVCSGLVHGYAYSAAVMDAYQALGGPMPHTRYHVPTRKPPPPAANPAEPAASPPAAAPPLSATAPPP